MQSKFTKSTDAQHKITLESSIVSASWLIAYAHGGTETPFEVLTSFVGEGTKIKVKCKTENGKTLATLSDEIHGNLYAGKLAIPDKVKLGDTVYFIVELSALGLKEESNHIPAGPPIKVTNMKWDKKVARRGDVLKLSADITNVAEGAEAKVIILEYDNDGSHDKIVEIPATVKNKKVELDWEYEYFEDTDEIPNQAQLQKYGKNYNPPEYFFVIEIDGRRFGEKQESGLLEFKDWVEIEFIDDDDQPMANADYVITFADGSQKTGKLDSNGVAMIEKVPPGTYEIEVTQA